MRILLILTILITSWSISAQETVYWASEILDISSEESPYEYSSIQVLHKPNVYPRSGKDPNAWRPKKPDNEENIVVGFSEAIKAKQIAIVETENPGAITKIYAYDSDFNEYLLREIPARDLPIENRLLNLFFDETEYPITAIKVVLDGEKVNGYPSIDAIGISSSNIPINVLINVSKGVNQEIDVEKLDDNVNSTYIEHSPILSPDGKRLYFSRQYHPDNIGGVDDNEDIWFSELDEETGGWLPAKNIGPPLNTKGPNFLSSVTEINGEEVLILGNRYGKKGRMFAGVSIAKRKGDSFTEPQNVIINNEYNYSPNADFFISPDGDVLILSVERDETYGKRDLYVSFKAINGNWTEPKNIGDDVNTLNEEGAPYLAYNNETLYFSSDGYSGYGGVDIYVTKRLDDSWTKWSEPENLGEGVNSEDDDVYINIPSSGEHIYFTRGDKDENTDIFRFNKRDFYVDPQDLIAESGIESIEDIEGLNVEPQKVVVTISGTVYDSASKEPIAANIMVERLPDGGKVTDLNSGSDGKYEFSVKSGARYGFLAESDGYLSVSENVDLNGITEPKIVDRDLYLVPIKTGSAIVLNNIFFDFDKAELKTASYSELKRILDLINKNRINKIAITGYTDDLASEDYNLNLSRGRAQAVSGYLTEKGVDENMLIVTGKGESDPMVPNTSPENRSKNRRVEFKVLE